MRDILVMLIFVPGAVAALRHPYIGVLLWVWIGVMNPHRLGWGFAYDLPLAMIAAVVTLVGMIVSRDRVRLPFAAPTAWLMVLFVWMGVTTGLAFLPDPSLEMFERVGKIFLMTFVALALIHAKAQIIALAWTVVVSLGFFGVKGGVFTAMSGGAYRVWGPPQSYVEGNNELALGLIIIISVMYFLAQQATNKWVRLGLIAAILLCALAVLGSHSRGALLAIVAMSGALWLRSRNKATVGLVLLVALPLMFAFMPEEWTQRMSTIITYEEDESAMGRINAWAMAFNIAKDRFFGAGFATASPILYHMYAPNPDFVLVAHSIYFQVLGEHGFVGLFIYLAFWISAFRSAANTARLAEHDPKLRWAVDLSRMVRVGLIGFAVGGAFLSLAYWDVPLYLMVLVVATNRFVRESIAQATRVGQGTRTLSGAAAPGPVAVATGQNATAGSLK